MVKSSSVQRSSKKLVTSVESSHPGILPPVKSFELKSNNTFAGRASDVFNRLSSLENEHSIWMASNETHGSFETDVSVDSMPDTSETDAFKKPCSSTGTLNKPCTSTTDTFKKPCTSTSDTFKKPFLPARRNRKHDFISKNKNTRVWRKYSLRDVPLASDAKNAAVAFQFLSELRKQKEESSSNETALDDGKVTFRKPVKRNLFQSTSSPRNKVSSSSKTVTEKLSENINSGIKLDHLEDEFEDE